MRAGGAHDWVVTEEMGTNGEIQEILRLNWRDFEGPGMADEEEKREDESWSSGSETDHVATPFTAKGNAVKCHPGRAPSFLFTRRCISQTQNHSVQLA